MCDQVVGNIVDAVVDPIFSPSRVKHVTPENDEHKGDIDVDQDVDAVVEGFQCVYEASGARYIDDRMRSVLNTVQSIFEARSTS